ncbi:hypothetical protein F4780DRAFT_605702 [Xylariomycetidae sp. FL0641]|nr:hypothetical protein F4780DRAFT_605702 [Xylariomycetidae sp. FL0641]
MAMRTRRCAADPNSHISVPASKRGPRQQALILSCLPVGATSCQLDAWPAPTGGCARHDPVVLPKYTPPGVHSSSCAPLLYPVSVEPTDTETSLEPSSGRHTSANNRSGPLPHLASPVLAFSALAGPHSSCSSRSPGWPLWVLYALMSLMSGRARSGLAGCWSLPYMPYGPSSANGYRYMSLFRFSFPAGATAGAEGQGSQTMPTPQLAHLAASGLLLLCSGADLPKESAILDQ